MRWEIQDDDSVTLRVSRRELTIINDSMNEVLEKVRDEEFLSIVGMAKGPVESQLRLFRSLRVALGVAPWQGVSSK